MRNGSIIISSVMASFLMAFVCQSCMYVPLDGSEDMPDSVAVHFAMNWPSGMQETDRPQQMHVAMSRIINTVHYVWQVDAAGNILDAAISGQDVESGGNDTPGDGSDSGTEEESPTSEKTIPNGEYYMMTFNDDPDTYDISDLDAFGNDPAVSMRALRARVQDLPAEEYAGMADFNPAFTYIKESTPLYIDVKQQRIAPTVSPEIAFDIKQLTQKLTFRVKIELEDGVEIGTAEDGVTETIQAEIAGVPRQVELMSALVRDSTCRVLFDMHKTGTEGNADIYQGEIDVLGLFPGSSQTDITGPGILQLTINALSGENQRRFHAGINISKTISSAGLMQQLFDRSGYRAARSSALVSVETLLRISNDEILPDEGSQGVEIWFDSEDNNIDVEV